MGNLSPASNEGECFERGGEVGPSSSGMYSQEYTFIASVRLGREELVL
jgi:hypothetical protein